MLAHIRDELFLSSEVCRAEPHREYLKHQLDIDSRINSASFIFVDCCIPSNAVKGFGGFAWEQPDDRLSDCDKIRSMVNWISKGARFNGK